ncbi:UbiA family prenyltransferase [Segetibacter aerophilus]|uniref:UbiA family prenyltransferase n=1 Tax=Segetibacter aerophilus TaxID=670293 RepID=UPI0011BE51CE|nr:UbiA family prenyltransferase [Segetibacter aerophilus]
MIYARSVRSKTFNERSRWYLNHLSTIKTALIVAIVLTVSSLIFLLSVNVHRLLSLSPSQFLLISAFPIAAAWYTFTPKALRLTKIRQVGWMKPFVVGLTWAGWVTIYPLIIWQVQRNESLHAPLVPLALLCLQNFLFFSINAIIFDIKDYRTDSYYHLKTYPVIFGVKKTIRFIVLPLVLINLVVFFLFQRQQNFSFLQTSIQLIPYILLVLIILRYRQGRKVLYYLAAVDGLVFLKAFCGITSILLIKK